MTTRSAATTQAATATRAITPRRLSAPIVAVLAAALAVSVLGSHRSPEAPTTPPVTTTIASA